MCCTLNSGKRYDSFFHDLKASRKIWYKILITSDKATFQGLVSGYLVDLCSERANFKQSTQHPHCEEVKQSPHLPENEAACDILMANLNHSV